MKCWTFLAILLAGLALSSLSVTAHEAESEVDRAARGAEKGQSDVDVRDDDDDIFVEKRAEAVSRLFHENNDKRDAIQQLRKRGWGKKVWGKIKSGAKKVWHTVVGKRDQLKAQAELEDEKRLAIQGFQRLQRRGWGKKVWGKIKSGAKTVWHHSKSYVIGGATGALLGKKDQLKTEVELNDEKRLTAGEFLRLQRRGWGKKVWGKIKSGAKKVWHTVVGKKDQLKAQAELEDEKRMAIQGFQRATRYQGSSPQEKRESEKN